MIEDEELKSLFQAESEERLKSLEEQLNRLDINPQDQEAIESAFRDAHTIKGSARMLNIQSIEMITHQIENQLDKVRKGEISLSSQSIQVLYKSISIIQSLVNEATTGQVANIDIQPILKALDFKNFSDQREIPTKKREPAEQQASASSVCDTFVAVATDEKQHKPDEALQPAGSRFLAGIANPSSPVNKEIISNQPKMINLKKWEQPISIQTVRIDVQQINHLMNQAIDLTVAKNRMTRIFERLDHLLDEWEEKYFPLSQSISMKFHDSPNNKTKKNFKLKEAFLEVIKEVGDNLGKLRNDTYEDVKKLDAIISSFTDQTQKLALLPLSKLFDFFPSMVRELAQSIGKEVELTIEGGQIKVDKKIIEEMKDPLMHLLRNAISHGIETPAERKLKKKPAKGLIQLIGKQSLNSILITISDDGNGLDTEKIKAIAVQRQLMSESEAEILTTSQIQSLILLPGFSTASQVSDISGRGVGLDVVKNQVEKLSGTLTIESEPNQGCSFSINLPILHITTQLIFVEADKKIYAFPMDIIETCLLITANQISTLEGYPFIMWENKPLSIFSLNDLIRAHDLIPSLAEEGDINVHSCIIVKGQGKRMALLVDKILDEKKVVVIPPDPLLSKVKSIIGTTLLKTGKICLILNPFNFIKSYNEPHPKKEL